jgi:hypothetical protein
VSSARDLIYAVCLQASLACTDLLYQGYRRTGMRLLLWGMLDFVCLGLNNTIPRGCAA